MAVLADNKNMNDLKHKIAKHENEKANKIEDLKGIISKFQTETPLVIMRKINEKQHLFDKVDSHDIAKEIEVQTGLHVDTDAIVMAHKIDTIGEYHVTLQTSSIKESFAVEVRAE
jgi:ribosomal protein L9